MPYASAPTEMQHRAPMRMRDNQLSCSALDGNRDESAPVDEPSRRTMERAFSELVSKNRDKVACSNWRPAACVRGDNQGKVRNVVAVPPNHHVNAVGSGRQPGQHLERRPSGAAAMVPAADQLAVDIQTIAVVNRSRILHAGQLLAGVAQRLSTRWFDQCR